MVKKGGPSLGTTSMGHTVEDLQTIHGFSILSVAKNKSLVDQSKNLQQIEKTVITYHAAYKLLVAAFSTF